MQTSLRNNYPEFIEYAHIKTDTADASLQPASPEYIGRQLHINRLIEAAYLGGDDRLPRTSDEHTPLTNLTDTIANSEYSTEPIYMKDGRLVGMVAAFGTMEFADRPELRAWGLNRHLGMLCALGATLKVGFPMTNRSLQAAIAVQSYATGTESSSIADDPYVSPGIGNVLDHMRSMMRRNWEVALDKDIGTFTSRYTYYLDIKISQAPSLSQLAGLPADRPDLLPAYNLYVDILDQIYATRSLVWHKQPDIQRIQQEEQKRHEAAVQRIDLYNSARHRVTGEKHSA